MIGLPEVYAVGGFVFAGYAVTALAERRWRSGVFWGLVAASFWAGDLLGDIGNGVLVLALAGLATLGLDRPAPAEPGSDPARDAAIHRNRLFVPALLVPVIAIGGTFLFKRMPASVDPKQATVVAVVTGILIAMAAAMWWLRPSPLAVVRDGRRLMDSVGWAALMPQMLAALGGVFAAAGVGGTIGGLVNGIIPAHNALVAVLAYGGGMALLTIAMGNAFAAFPVMTAAIGVPLLMHGFGADPAAVAAIGMLCGFCGTLVTPMAANFNLVPAALLELKDRYAVIRAQAPSAGLIWIANILILYVVVTR